MKYQTFSCQLFHNMLSIWPVTESYWVVQSCYRVILSWPIRLQSHIELSNHITESYWVVQSGDSHVELSNQSLVVCFRQSAQPVARGSTTAIPTSPALWTQRTSGESSRTVVTSSSACTSDSTSSCDWSSRISRSTSLTNQESDWDILVSP